LQISVATLLLS